MSIVSSLDQIVALCKRRGFVFPTSSIYGGLTSSYEYGPLGVQLKKNISDAWWKAFVTDRRDMVGLDSQIMLHPETWVASGHVGSFNDPLIEDTVTHKRYRADHLIEGWIEQNNREKFEALNVEGMSLDEMNAFIKENNILSPDGNQLSDVKVFNLLFETSIGSVNDTKEKVYLRGETAQGIFSNFKHILDSTRVKLPFGVGQIGKSFRNEITTGQFIFRTLEFEQAEIEYFFNPEETSWEPLFDEWQKAMWQFVTETLGISEQNLRWREHSDTERSFYSKKTVDLEYHFPFGWKELWGIAYRTDYDLKQHEKHSGQQLKYQDPYSQKSFVPHVIEPAVGINRLLLMVLCESYCEDADHKRTVLNLPPQISPYRTAVFPLVKNKPELVEKAQEVFDFLAKSMPTTWDDRGNIGKRYLAQDEIGTPWCITVDYETLENNTVTVRNRDTTEQVRVKVGDLVGWITQLALSSNI